MTTTVGQRLKFQTASGRYHHGFVTHVVTGDTVHLTCFSDGSEWADVGYGTQAAGISGQCYLSVSMGSGVGEWQAVNVESYATTGELDDYATHGDVSTAIAAIPYDPGRMAIAGAGSSAGLTLGAAGVQLSTTRPTSLVVRGTASMTSTLAGGQAFTVELRCDSGATPTAVVDDASGSLTQTLGLTVTLAALQPWKLVYNVPAGHYVRVVQSAGAATLALTGATKQVL